MKFRTILFIVLACLPTPNVFGTVLLNMDNRALTTSGSSHVCTFNCIQPYDTAWNLTVRPSLMFGTFNTTLHAPDNTGTGVVNMLATQTSSVVFSPNRTTIDASGMVWYSASISCPGASSGGCVLSGSVSSVFDLVFILTDPELYQLSYTDGGFTDRNMRLSQQGGGTISNTLGSSSGTLQPGTYTVHVEQSGALVGLNGDTPGLFGPPMPYDAYHLSLQLESDPTDKVPEPSSLVALLAGLAGLFLIWRLRLM